jgi:undecaprenyl-diphosphatase
MVSDIIFALILAVVQGVTEWFPVSSSGHLILFEGLLGYEGALLFEVALHFGTLMAVFVYFGKDITDMFRDILLGRWNTQEGKLGLLIIVASVPAAIVGFMIKDIFEMAFSGLGILAFGFGITGLFLLITSLTTSFTPDRSRELSSAHEGEGINMGYGKALLIGIGQALAIVPGISRSGATISSGILLGLDEKRSMKFAFLMSIPIIFGANILTIGNKSLPPELIWATLISFVVGLASIHIVFKYVLIKRENFRWFAVYCLLLAMGIGFWVFANRFWI